MITDATLQGWTGPSSSTEQEKQERTERMIRAAINEHAAFKGVSLTIYAKGSYANNTNVRSDSDVDIVVECGDCVYWQEHDPAVGGHPQGESYKGEWTPQKLRAEVGEALRAKFGASSVSEGSAAWTVRSNTARVDADVVPCFTFRYYFANGSYREGTKLFTKDGKQIQNYPNLQLKHGRDKNVRTGLAYKRTVRIMKRLENRMVDQGVSIEVPSYLLECLVYNAPDHYLTRSTWREVMRGVLAHAYNYLNEPEPMIGSERFVEANEAKYLFHGGQKWTRESVFDFVKAAWNHMDYDA